MCEKGVCQNDNYKQNFQKQSLKVNKLNAFIKRMNTCQIITEWYDEFISSFTFKSFYAFIIKMYFQAFKHLGETIIMLKTFVKW